MQHADCQRCARVVHQDSLTFVLTDQAVKGRASGDTEPLCVLCPGCLDDLGEWVRQRYAEHS